MPGWIGDDARPFVSLSFACLELGFDQGDNPWNGGLGCFVGVGCPTAWPRGPDKSYDGCRFAPPLRRRFTATSACEQRYDCRENQAQRDKGNVDNDALNWFG